MSTRKSDSPTSVDTVKPSLRKRVGNVVTMTVDDRLAPATVGDTLHTASRHLEIRLQVLRSRPESSLRLAALTDRSSQYNTTSRRARVTRYVQPPLTTRPRQRAEVQRHYAFVVGAEGNGEQDGVALVALHVLEILDEQAVRFVERLQQRSSPASRRRFSIRSRCGALKVITPSDGSDIG